MLLIWLGSRGTPSVMSSCSRRWKMRQAFLISLTLNCLKLIREQLIMEQMNGRLDDADILSCQPAVEKLVVEISTFGTSLRKVRLLKHLKIVWISSLILSTIVMP